MTSGIALITIERSRQINEKQHTSHADDSLPSGSLLAVAVRIAEDLLQHVDVLDYSPLSDWHWSNAVADHVTDKYEKDPIRRLTIAGALIAAEIDRLLRAQEKAND